MRPVIGITCGTAGVPVAEGILPSHYVGVGYPRAVWAAGGRPVLLPSVNGAEAELAQASLRGLDGLVLAGGTDLDPATYGADLESGGAQHPDPSRDAFELSLLDAADSLRLPVLGICRGFQMLNVWSGGTLCQHRPHTASVPLDFQGLRVETTSVRIETDSAVGAVFGANSLSVYCLHHQAIDRLGPGLRIVGLSDDGIVEAVERIDRAFMVGLLWHPEQMLDSADSIKPYRALVDASRRREVTHAEATTGRGQGS